MTKETFSQQGKIPFPEEKDLENKQKPLEKEEKKEVKQEKAPLFGFTKEELDDLYKPDEDDNKYGRR